MNRQFKIITSLLVVSVICGLILSYTYKYTKDDIILAERLDFLIGLKEVLPPYDNEPDKDIIEMGDITVYQAIKDNQVAGYAVIFSSGKGYGGTIQVLVGMAIDGTISGVSILKHKETPGLGDKITNKTFLDTFQGLFNTNNIAVRKDGGVIDQFSGATMSPRAVSDAVKRALQFLQSNFITN